MRAAALLGARMPGLGASLLVAAPASPASADSPACAAFATFPNPDMLKSMRRGVNLPGWDNPDESERPTIAQLQALHDRGFTHIRLPLDEKQLSGPASDAYLDQMFAATILLLSLDYTVSLDLHAGGTIGAMFRDNPQAAEQHLGDVWNEDRAPGALARSGQGCRRTAQRAGHGERTLVAGRRTVERGDPAHPAVDDHHRRPGRSTAARSACRPGAAGRCQCRLRDPLLRSVRLHASGRRLGRRR